MATFIEINASHDAEIFHLLLVKALQTHKPQIIEFAYKNIFPLYEMASAVAQESLDSSLVVRLRQELVC